MKTKTLLLAVSLLLAALAFLFHTTSCTMVYTGCTKDSECNTAAGEVCIDPENHGECGLPSDFCDDGDTRDCIAVNPDYKGICIEKKATCFGGVWEQCEEPEICDGLDNDCNGRVDDGVPGVNDLCSVGIGLCTQQGQQYCTSAQELQCNATALPPSGQIGCDCDDNDCDGIEDDHTLELAAPLLTPTPTEAARADWSFTVTSTGHYAAAASTTVADEINIINMDTNEVIGTSRGHSPALIDSPTHGLVLFYIASNEDPDPTKLQDEVFVRAIDPLTATFGDEICKGCDEANAFNYGSAIYFDWLYVCYNDSANTSATPRCSDGTDNDNDGATDMADEGCENEEDNSEADCSYAITYVRGLNHRVSSLRVFEKSLNTMTNSIGFPLSGLSFDTEVIAARMDMAESLVFMARVGNDVSGGGLLELVSGQLRHRYFPKNKVVVESGIIADETDFDLVGLASGEVVIVWNAGATIKIQSFQPVVEAGRNDMIPLYIPVEVTPLTTGDRVSNINVKLLCSTRALMTYEVTSGVNSVVESLIFDVSDGSTLLPPSTALAGTSPLLMNSEMGTYLGALRPATGDSLPAGTPVIPGFGEIACDSL